MMIEPKIKEPDIRFRRYIYPRNDTELIVIHHTGTTDNDGNPVDDDLSAEEIHKIHCGFGWSGIGYHFVIRKDGTIEAGRPEWAQGAHAEDFNWKSIGIHVCGNFCGAEPTDAQIENLSYLVGYLCEKYDLVPNADHVIGHRDLMPTACPGDALYEMLQTIRGKAIWYQQHYQKGD